MKITPPSDFDVIFHADVHRYGGMRIFGTVLTFIYFLRKASFTKNKFYLLICRIVLRHWRNKYGIEISPKTKIGKGLYLGHPYCITINSDTIIGNYCSLHKGVTIGQEYRGKRVGCPIIGNKVWIGVNATIVGNVTIGDDVLIAPNCFVNKDIPSHSVVFGNPCIIKHKEAATELYIRNIKSDDSK